MLIRPSWAPQAPSDSRARFPATCRERCVDAEHFLEVGHGVGISVQLRKCGTPSDDTRDPISRGKSIVLDTRTLERAFERCKGSGAVVRFQIDCADSRVGLGISGWSLTATCASVRASTVWPAFARAPARTTRAVEASGSRAQSSRPRLIASSYGSWPVRTTTRDSFAGTDAGSDPHLSQDSVCFLELIQLVKRPAEIESGAAHG